MLDESERFAKAQRCGHRVRLTKALLAHAWTGKLKGWRFSCAATAIPFTNWTAQLSLRFYILKFGMGATGVLGLTWCER